MVKFYDITIILIFLLVFEFSSWTCGVRVEQTIKELIQPTINGRKQGVYLAEYSPEYSIVLDLLEKQGAPDKARPEKEEGEFFVRAPTNYGLMVVIQYLNLRTQVRGPNLQKTYTYCRDYIHFSDTRNKESSQICGYLYVRDNNITPEKLLGPRTFYSSKGEINVKLFIDNSTAEEMTDYLWNAVQLIFTAVSDCQNGGKPGEFVRPCYPQNSSETAISSNVPSSNCIASSLFCDDYYNCGFDGQLVGTDELDCGKSNLPTVKQETSSGGGNSMFMIICIVFGIIILLVFIGAYVVAEMNVSCLRCPLISRLQHGTSTTGISKANEKDEVSTSNPSPSNYSSFTIEETR